MSKCLVNIRQASVLTSLYSLSSAWELSRSQRHSACSARLYTGTRRTPSWTWRTWQTARRKHKGKAYIFCKQKLLLYVYLQSDPVQAPLLQCHFTHKASPSSPCIYSSFLASPCRIPLPTRQTTHVTPPCLAPPPRHTYTTPHNLTQSASPPPAEANNANLYPHLVTVRTGDNTA